MYKYVSSVLFYQKVLKGLALFQPTTSFPYLSQEKVIGLQNVSFLKVVNIFILLFYDNTTFWVSSQQLLVQNAHQQNLKKKILPKTEPNPFHFHDDPLVQQLMLPPMRTVIVFSMLFGLELQYFFIFSSTSNLQCSHNQCTSLFL